MANTLKIKRGTAATIPQGQLAEPLFTTDTYDLYIGKGSGGNQRIQNYIASGTSSQFLKGDGSLDSNTYQTALTFSSPLVNTSGTISIPVATGSVDGYLSSTDWTTFNSKEPAITAGTTLQYYRGDKTFQTLDTAAVPENGSIYFTEPRVRATVLTGLNLTGGGTIAATDSILQAFGKVQNQISALVGSVYYAGTWNASTNSPTLASGTGTKGYYYIVTTAGSTNLDGITDWKIGDWAIFNGTTWDKVDNTDAVSSVNGFTGAVNLALDNISDVSAASPTNAQLLRFNGTSSLWENWTPTFEPALTKGNLSSGDTSYLTVTGGTGAVIGSGTTVSVYAAGVINGGLTLTTTGNSGAATKSFATLNIPEYTLAGLGGVPTTRTITINGTALDLSANRSWSVGTVTGTGTTGTIPKWSSSSALNDSVITQSGSDILIGGTADQGKLQVDGQTAGGVLVTTTDSQFGIAIKNTSSSNKKWDFSPNGNNLQFNESGVEPVLILKGGGGNNVRLYKYTSNGFLKTSGSDGTLTVDTTSYLPLGGGTLTGALSGTSATFSGNGLFGGATAFSGGIAGGVSVNGSTSSGINFRIADATKGYLYVVSTGSVYLESVAGSIVLSPNGVPALSMSSTGAASFSSSVTAGGNLNLQGAVTRNINFYDSSNTNINAQIQYDQISSTSGQLFFGTNNAGTFATRLTIANTGAATFSSAAAGYAMSITNVEDSSQGLLLRSTDADTTLYLARFQSSASAVSTTWVDRFSIAKNGSTIIGDGVPSTNVRLVVKGEDQTAANYALILEDSLGQDIAWFRNDKVSRFHGNVGIGITPDGSDWNASATLLHIYQNSTNGALLKLESSNAKGMMAVGNDQMQFGTISTDPLIFYTNSAEKMRIDSSAANVVTLRGTQGTQGSYFSSIEFNNSGNVAAAIRPIRFNDETAADLSFWTREYLGSLTQRFTIARNGVSTFTSSVLANSPSEGATGEGLIAGRSFKIDATGTGQTAKMYMVSKDLSDTYGSGLTLQGANFAGDKAFGFNLNTSGGFELYVKNSSGSFVQAMKIAQDRATTFTGNKADDVLRVNNIRNNSSGDYALVTLLGTNTTNTNSYHYIAATDGGGDKMYVYGNGNIVNVNNSYGTLSDIKLKENIVDATPKLNDILKLKVRNFNLIGDTTKQIGFIAQEFEEIFPKMVDIDGKSGNKLIKSSVLVPMLVKAIQELKAEIDSLKN